MAVSAGNLPVPPALTVRAVRATPVVVPLNLVLGTSQAVLRQVPLLLVDVKDAYFPLRTGDRVQFRRIDEREFAKLKGERL